MLMASTYQIFRKRLAPEHHKLHGWYPCITVIGTSMPGLKQHIVMSFGDVDEIKSFQTNRLNSITVILDAQERIISV